jgi:hypothetical protein
MTDFKKTTLPIFYAKICVSFKENDSDVYHNVKRLKKYVYNIAAALSFVLL